jgi:hypothetical protein
MRLRLCEDVVDRAAWEEKAILAALRDDAGGGAIDGDWGK